MPGRIHDGYHEFPDSEDITVVDLFEPLRASRLRFVPVDVSRSSGGPLELRQSIRVIAVCMRQQNRGRLDLARV